MIAIIADFTGFDRQRYGDIRDIIEKTPGWLMMWGYTIISSKTICGYNPTCDIPNWYWIV
jgi:hypothetical protein